MAEETKIQSAAEAVEHGVYSAAARFKALFDGHAGLYGIYNNVAATGDEHGKRIGADRRTTKGVVTVDLYRQHLAGRSGLGICPIRGDSTVRFGAIDIDQYAELSHAGIAAKLASIKLPLVVCRSKSGGATSMPSRLNRSQRS